MSYSIPTWNRAVFLLVSAVAAYFQTWVELWPYWENKNATYTHGMLIAAVTLWLIWKARRTLSRTSPTASARALALVLLLSVTWVVAARANLFIVHAMIWPALALVILWAGVGWQAASKLAFPLSFLYFAIPIWDYLKPPLQIITSGVVGYLTGFLGLPASIDGPYITLPQGTIFIALDCSGAHFLCVALAVGVLAGVMRGDQFHTRVLIVVLAGFLSMVFNWLRILLIVLAHLHETLLNALESIGHFTFGWWVFALDLFVFGCVLRFVPAGRRSLTPPASMEPELQDLYGVRGFALAIVAALLVPTLVWGLPRSGSYAIEPTTPISLPGTVGQTSSDARWQPQFPGAAWEHRTAYLTTDGQAFELYANAYHAQTQGQELISRGSDLFHSLSPGAHVPSVVKIEAHGTFIEAQSAQLVDEYGTPWLAVYTYTVDQDTVANERRVQMITALRSLYRRTTAGVLALAMPCKPDCKVVGARLERALLDVRDAYLGPKDRAELLIGR